MHTANENDKQAIVARKNKGVAVVLGLGSVGIYFAYILTVYLTGAN